MLQNHEGQNLQIQAKSCKLYQTYIFDHFGGNLGVIPVSTLQINFWEHPVDLSYWLTVILLWSFHVTLCICYSLEILTRSWPLCMNVLQGSCFEYINFRKQIVQYRYFIFVFVLHLERLVILPTMKTYNRCYKYKKMYT